MKYNTKNINLKSLSCDLLCFCGDIHGEFKTFLYEIKRLNIKDAIIVICGDIGMGFNKPTYYEQELGKICKKLKELNVTVVCIRGNHDDPQWFKNTIKLSEHLANYYPNWIFVDDYDILETQFGNILCVGGARSVDKNWRIPGKTWWEGENIIPLDGYMLMDINKRCNNVDIIATHSAPDFCEPLSKQGLMQWSIYDSTVIEDCENERKELTNIFNEISKYHNVKYWFYGHFHNSYYTFYGHENKETQFYGLNIMEFKDIIKND